MLIPIGAARANAYRTDWALYVPPVPTFIGRRPFRNVDLKLLVPFIDWSPFFQAWGVPTSEQARQSIARLPAWMPPDFPAK